MTGSESERKWEMSRKEKKRLKGKRNKTELRRGVKTTARKTKK